MSWRRPISCLALLLMGCTGSRWARDDEDYARKYPRHTDNVLKTAKQAVDARHVVGKEGWYAGFTGRDDPVGAGAEAGLFIYPRSWLETRVGLAALGHEGEHPISGGGLVGVRVQPPTRLAPFVGVNGYLGWVGFADATHDQIDNDDNGLVDEPGETDLDFMTAIAPEVGVHYWLTSQWRLTGKADYLFTSDGRDVDSIYYGVSLAWLFPGQCSPMKSRPDRRDWNFAEGADTRLPPMPEVEPTANPDASDKAAEKLSTAGDVVQESLEPVTATLDALGESGAASILR